MSEPYSALDTASQWLLAYTYCSCSDPSCPKLHEEQIADQAVEQALKQAQAVLDRYGVEGDVVIRMRTAL